MVESAIILYMSGDKIFQGIFAGKECRMELSIRNFAKIKEADIVIDGITVIAGENNTGKSTVGKILFSMFNALLNVEQEIFEERLKEIENTNRVILQNYIADFDMTRSLVSRNVYNIARRINNYLRKSADGNWIIADEVIRPIIAKELKELERVLPDDSKVDYSYVIDEIYRNITEVMNIPEEDIVLEVISRFFNNVFSSQVNSLSDSTNSEAVLRLKIKGKQEKLFFRNNVCNGFTDEINIIHKAIYIDNPFIIDGLTEYTLNNPMDHLLKILLIERMSGDLWDGVVDTVRVKEKLSDVYMTLQSVVDGEVIQNPNGDFFLKKKNYNKPIAFSNLSTGIKSFVILKMLLENGSLREKDVLILDEPEIHLHPQWQIVYAELIVLLQKHFDLSVVVTTHSPYFVDAVNLFSCKYKTDSRVNYYLSEKAGDAVIMNCVTDNINLIYEKMASPIQMLDTLRYELNNN